MWNVCRNIFYKLFPTFKQNIHERFNLCIIRKFKTKNSCIEGGGNPDTIYLFKVNNGNTTTICETCSKLTIKPSDLHH